MAVGGELCAVCVTVRVECEELSVLLLAKSCAMYVSLLELSVKSSVYCYGRRIVCFGRRVVRIVVVEEELCVLLKSCMYCC